VRQPFSEAELAAFCRAYEPVSVRWVKETNTDNDYAY
jgi:hypothetical protein